MSTADFVFIESEDPHIPRFICLLYCFEGKIPRYFDQRKDQS